MDHFKEYSTTCFMWLLNETTIQQNHLCLAKAADIFFSHHCSQKKIPFYIWFIHLPSGERNLTLRSDLVEGIANLYKSAQTKLNSSTFHLTRAQQSALVSCSFPDEFLIWHKFGRTATHNISTPQGNTAPPKKFPSLEQFPSLKYICSCPTCTFVFVIFPLVLAKRHQHHQQNIWSIQ